MALERFEVAAGRHRLGGAVSVVTGRTRAAAAPTGQAADPRPLSRALRHPARPAPLPHTAQADAHGPRRSLRGVPGGPRDASSRATRPVASDQRRKPP